MKKINIPIIDLFPCIQGEGILAGVPHILIRTSGCNLRCAFRQSVCDTAYSSWNPEKGVYDTEDVFRLIEKNPQIKHVMITGGEPFLHAEHLYRLIDKLYEWKLKITVETNGTFYVPIKVLKKIALMSVSPKLKSSTPYLNSRDKAESKKRESHNDQRINIQALAQIAKYAKQSQFKFVYGGEDDVCEIKEIMSKVEDMVCDDLTDKIMLMPEGTEREQLEVSRKKAIELCIQHGWRYTDRLHIIAYGSERNA